VIAATGLQTPGRLAQGAGLDWQNGIAVDLQTLRICGREPIAYENRSAMVRVKTTSRPLTLH